MHRMRSIFLWLGFLLLVAVPTITSNRLADRAYRAEVDGQTLEQERRRIAASRQITAELQLAMTSASDLLATRVSVDLTRAQMQATVESHHIPMADMSREPAGSSEDHGNGPRHRRRARARARDDEGAPGGAVSRRDRQGWRGGARPRALGPARLRPVAVGALVVDFVTHTATRDRSPVEMTVLEGKLLSYFLRNEGRLLSRASILAAVWGGR